LAAAAAVERRHFVRQIHSFSSRTPSDGIFSIIFLFPNLTTLIPCHGSGIKSLESHASFREQRTASKSMIQLHPLKEEKNFQKKFSGRGDVFRSE
jgi:hypothetical protein